MSQGENFGLVWDFWKGGFGLQDIAGDNCVKLTEQYTIEAARNAAMAQMWQCVDNTDGSLTIYHPEGGTMTVQRDGTVDNNGFVGSGCTASSAIENALGRARETSYKAEFYAEKVRVTV